MNVPILGEVVAAVVNVAVTVVTAVGSVLTTIIK